MQLHLLGDEANPRSHRHRSRRRGGQHPTPARPHGLTLKQILITHGHIDHVGGALRLKRLTGAPIYMNENDLPQLKMMATQASWLGIETPQTAPPDAGLADGQTVGLETSRPQSSIPQDTPRVQSAFTSLRSSCSSQETRSLPAASDAPICPAETPNRSSFRFKSACSAFPMKPMYYQDTAQ